LDTRFKLVYGRAYLALLEGRRPWDEWDGDEVARRQVLNAVGSAIDASPMPLREDARLFLLASVDAMVARPLTHATSLQKVPDLSARVGEDINAIIKAAIPLASGRQALAASHVLRGTAAVLDQLHLKSWKLWEKDDD
jgi:hypothetical protein